MSMRKRVGIIWGVVIIIVIVLIAVVSIVRVRNSLNILDEDVNAAWADVDNQLQRRADLIPNLVNTVKGYAAHEEGIFTEIANARAKLAGGGSVAEKAEGYSELEGALSRLLVIVENYPNLKADANFTRLMDELAGTENRIAVARKRYNDQVKIYNQKIRVFPTSMFANSMGFEARDYFEIDESARTVPTVNFTD